MRICLVARAGLELVTFRSQSRRFPSTPHMKTVVPSTIVLVPQSSSAFLRGYSSRNKPNFRKCVYIYMLLEYNDNDNDNDKDNDNEYYFIYHK